MIATEMAGGAATAVLVTMAKIVLHRLPNDLWRVTDAPDDWQDDGRPFPEPQESDRYFTEESDAVREWMIRTHPRDPDDDTAV